MNPQHQLQLEDAQKKLALFRKHLELIARCTGESKNIQKDEILSAVAELQSLVEWAALQPNLEATSAILLVKLQELNQIRENLEKTSSETVKTSISENTNDEESAIIQKTDCSPKDVVDPDVVPANSCTNYGENDTEEEFGSVDKDSLCDYSASTEERNIANAESPESIDDTNVEIIPTDDKTDEVINLDDSDNVTPMNGKGIIVNSDQTSSVNTETLHVHKELETEGLELSSRASELKSPDLYRSEVIIIETDEDNKSAEWINDPKNSNDPLDVCMYAIRNLYESLRVKENELLKLSAMQSDQKQIEALQAVIIDFHKDITNLNSEIEQTKKENMLLKEQVLELEEAENDARLVAQKLEQKLIFLQEKDSHSQAELSQLKQSLKKCTETLAEKEKVEKELRSQIRYMETLVQKYEDQIKTMEAKEIEAAQKKLDSQAKCNTEIQVKPDMCNKGTQMYTFSQSTINRITANNGHNTNANNGDSNLNQSHADEILEDSKYTSCENTESADTTICSIDLTSVIAPAHCSVQADIVNLENIENTSQKGLLKRLHKLIDEDVNLQQQIHYVDEINLAMWKKLQNLDNHIGECKRQNINETNPAFAETDLKAPSDGNLEVEKIEVEKIEVETNTNDAENIPQDSLNSLDQNEHYIQQRLNKLKEINASFEKELKNRENLCKEKEKKYDEWMETEKRVIEDLNRLAEEKNWITNQINRLKNETATREKLIFQLEQEIISFKNKNQEELSKIRAHQEEMTEPLTLKVNHMLTKEKEILKMISNFKLKENRSQGKNELERLKCSYIELQLELSQSREEIRKIEEKFKHLQDQCADKLASEEIPRSQELQRIRHENVRCNKIINDLEENERDLIIALEKQEKYLHEIRENYKKNIEEAEEEHRIIETELESHIRLIEEGAAIATTVLKEERLKAEKELEENIKDLKAKEEVYKSRIAELERDVINLHQELHKMTADSYETGGGVIDNLHQELHKMTTDSHEIEGAVIDNLHQELHKMTTDSHETEGGVIDNLHQKPHKMTADTEEKKEDTQLQEKIPDEIIEKSIEILSSKTEISEIAPRKLPRSAIDVNLKSPAGTLKKSSLQAAKDEKSNHTEIKQSKVKEKAVEENVDELRAQVRELQSHIEKISEEVAELPPIQTAKPITALSLNMQKEDIDYAEVDECCSEAVKKQSTSSFKQGSYENKYTAGLKNTLKNQKAVEDLNDENDYDEVLPRPTNFHVVQKVGSDTLLVGWNYVNPSVLEGFEVYVNDQVHDRIYIPDRTKALISGLNLRKTLRLSIYALSRYGQLSEPAMLEISPQLDHNTNYFDDEEDEYRDFEDPMNQNKRPYSMEW